MAENHDFYDTNSDGKVETYQDGGAAGNLQITNVENLEGGAGDDTLIGSSSANELKGGAGDDQHLVGGAGNDILRGETHTIDISGTQGTTKFI